MYRRDGSAAATINFDGSWMFERKLKENETQFQFWKRYSCSTNIVERSLAEIAKQYLTPPPTSVDVERLFSSAANILTKKRNHLNPENLEKLVFCRQNLPKVNFQY